jgi:hypothetical protein
MQTVIIDCIKYQKAADNLNYAVVTGAEHPHPALVVPERVSIGGTQYEVQEIAKMAFHQGPFTSISLPKTIREIGGQAFSSNKGLTTVTIAPGSQLEIVGHGAFWGCAGLTSFAIPRTTKELGVWAFRDCKKLSQFTIDDVPNSQLYKIGESCFECCDLKEFILPKAVKKIQRRAFQTNWELSRFVFDDFQNSELWRIESGAFAETALEEMTFPPKLKDYGSWMFFGAQKIRKVEFTQGSGVYHIGAWNFEDTKLTEFTVPNTVHTIEAGAFWRINTLTSVRFEKGSQLVRIASNAFSETPITGTLNLAATLHVLDIETFQKTPRLEAVTTPAESECDILHPRIFEQSGIKLVQFPGVRVIEDDVFKECTALRVARFALPTQSRTQQQREVIFPVNIFQSTPRVFVTWPTGTLKKARNDITEALVGDFI